MDETEEERIDRLAAEEAADPMGQLEAKTVDSKREMDILDALQDMRTRNARMELADADTVLQRVSSRRDVDGLDVDAGASEAAQRRRLEEEEDEAEVRRVFGRLPTQPGGIVSIELEEPPVIEDDDGEDDSAPRASGSGSTYADMLPPPVPAVKQTTVKRKLVEVEPDARSLLSESAQAMTSALGAAGGAASAPPLPSKRKKNASSKLGIKKKDG